METQHTNKLSFINHKSNYYMYCKIKAYKQNCSDSNNIILPLLFVP